MSLSAVEKFNSLKAPQQLLEKILHTEGGKKISTSPLSGSSKALFIKSLSVKTGHVFVLFPEVRQAEEFYVELDILSLSKQTLIINEFKPEILQEKITEISKRDKLILISTYELLQHRFPSREKIDRNTTVITTGENISYDELNEYFNLLNYQRDKYVGAPGEYSVRGSIVDFWSYSEKNPVRIEYDGDFIESVRFFDAESQRSTEQIESVTLAAKISADAPGEFTDIFDFLKAPVVLASSFDLNNFDYKPVNAFSEQEEQPKTDVPDEETNDLVEEFPLPENGEENKPVP